MKKIKYIFLALLIFAISVLPVSNLETSQAEFLIGFNPIPVGWVSNWLPLPLCLCSRPSLLRFCRQVTGIGFMSYNFVNNWCFQKIPLPTLIEMGLNEIPIKISSKMIERKLPFGHKLYHQISILGEVFCLVANLLIKSWWNLASISIKQIFVS